MLDTSAMPAETAEKEAKQLAADSRVGPVYLMESVKVVTIGKVRTAAVKPAPKPKKVKPVKVKEGTPIEWVK